MYQFIHSFALAAALLTLIASLWQGWGTAPCLKRMILAYLGFFFLGGFLAVLVRSASLFDPALSKPVPKPNRSESPEAEA